MKSPFEKNSDFLLFFWLNNHPIRQHDGIKYLICPDALERDK
jgi:hypothetical protein